MNRNAKYRFLKKLLPTKLTVSKLGDSEEQLEMNFKGWHYIPIGGNDPMNAPIVFDIYPEIHDNELYLGIEIEKNEGSIGNSSVFSTPMGGISYRCDNWGHLFWKAIFLWTVLESIERGESEWKDWF